MNYGFNNQDNESDDEQCFCSHCSELDIFETVMKSLERIQNLKKPDEIVDVLYDLCEYSKVIGIREYLFTNMVDQSVVLDSLSGITFEDDFDAEEEYHEDVYEIDMNFNTDITNTEESKQPKRGYWNTPFNK